MPIVVIFDYSNAMNKLTDRAFMAITTQNQDPLLLNIYFLLHMVEFSNTILKGVAVLEAIHDCQVLVSYSIEIPG